MITLPNLTGLGSIAILIATAAMLLFRLMRIQQPYLALLTLAVAVIVCIPVPFGGLPPAAYLRGMIGDLSITSVVLLTLTLLKYLTSWQPFRDKERVFFWSVVVMAALVLYPLALGIGYIDPYRLGFGNIWFLGALFVITLAAYLKRFYVVVLCIALAIFAWSVGWNESTNLWNYLLDPFVGIYAIGALIHNGVNSLAKLQRGKVR
ncbi:MAG: hypothetical protein ABI210_07790 [Abditibacteriaceae bacterium]